jgi:hypothetical protein
VRVKALLAKLAEWRDAHRAGCTCALRWFGVAFDIDCPLHGLGEDASSFPITRDRSLAA